jgi:hypothetical protein
MPLALVHLVREANGEAPLLQFLESYRRHPAGIEHELVLLLKGFSDRAAIDRYAELAGGARWVAVSDAGYDIGAYFAAARALAHANLCFVNSFSVVQADDWLARLAKPVIDGQAGLVGATGSWASQLSYQRFYLGLGGPYKAWLGDRRRFMALLARLNPPGEGGRTARHYAVTALDMVRRCADFERFPAHHLRTNAFCIPRAVMLATSPGRQRAKFDAYRLESGRKSLTNQVEALGLRAVVTGRDGQLYDPPDWARSRTFWQRDQENLLVADNQTRVYANGDHETRAGLAAFAWGAEADPVLARDG